MPEGETGTTGKNLAVKMLHQTRPNATLVEEARLAVTNAIPPAWTLGREWLQLPQDANVMDIPRMCGILTPAQIAITEQTATELLPKLAKGLLSSVEVTTAFCARAAIAHQLTNCLTEFFPDEAIQTATALDRCLQQHGKPLGPLHGLPIGIKNMYDLEGHRSDMSYIAWLDQFAEKDSALVAILRQAGAVFYCKTTMPQTGMMLETRSPLWGVTVSPFNRKLVPGGSSGGDGALVAMRGSPVTPSSDIGGSIRSPAAFNGLYSIRPTADRIPKGGLRSAAPGNISIKVSSGPVCHSVEDIRLFTKLFNAHGSLCHYEPGIVPLPWRDLTPPVERLSLGLWDFDGVCKPHPPILRALQEAAAELSRQGHQVIPVKMPFDCWEVAWTTWKLYFQTGFKESKALLSSAGEEMEKAMQSYLQIFDIKELTVPELFACNLKQAGYKRQMAEWWESTSSLTRTERPIDGILCPVHPSASYPHEFPSWWGYTSLWNILDYPSTTIPVQGFKISEQTDPKHLNYRPRDNAFDRPTHAMYDPNLFERMPVCLQVVGRPYQDEELIEVTGVVDKVLNGTKQS